MFGVTTRYRGMPATQELPKEHVSQRVDDKSNWKTLNVHRSVMIVAMPVEERLTGTVKGKGSLKKIDS